MTTEYLLEILSKANFLKRGSVNAGYARFPCPFRRWLHPNPVGEGGNAYSLDCKTLRGHCFVCGESASLFEIMYFRALEGDGDADLFNLAMEILAATPEDGDSKLDDAFDEGLSVFDTKRQERDIALEELEKKFNGFPLSTMSEYSLRYMRMREVEPTLIEDNFRTRFDRDEMRLCQHLFNLQDGSFMGVMGRTVVEGVQPKTRHYLGSQASKTLACANREEFWESSILFLVEGMFDMYHVWSQLRILKVLGFFSVACVNTCRLSDEQALLLSKKCVPTYVMFDNDEAGEKGGASACQKLKKVIPFVRQIGLPDGVGDPAELKIHDMEEILRRVLK